MTKYGLAAVFLLGVVLLLVGIHGQKVYDASGFSSESAYQAIYALGDDTASAWEQVLRPSFGNLTEEERSLARGIALTLLTADWEGRRAGGGEDASALAGTDEALTWKLLYASYLVNGPKVSASQRREILSSSAPDEPGYRLMVLHGLLSSDAPLPAGARSVAEGLSGPERQAALAQVLFVASGSTSGDVSDHTALLKKSVRDKGRQVDAFRMIGTGGLSWLQRLVVSYSRTVMLLGVFLMLDAGLLALLMRAEGTWRMDLKWILVLLIADFLLFFQLMPIVYMVVRALFPEGSFTLKTLERLYTESMNLDALKNTLAASFATMLLGTLIAFPLAWLVGRTNLYGKRFFRFLFVVSYMVPPYVGAMAWLRLMNPNVGTVNQWLRALFSLSDARGPLNVYTLPGVIWVLTTFYYPYAFITISRAMEKMDPSLEEASRISGAPPLRTVFRITLPMMTPSLIAGALLVFISAASCYGIPSIVGTPGNVNMVTTRIVEYVGKGQQELNDATGLSVFLMGTALLVLFLSDGLLARRQYITVSGKSVRPVLVDLRKGRLPLTVAVSLFALVVIVLPFLTILATSFKTDIGKSVTDAGNFTLANWSGVFSRSETVSCLTNSLLFASAAATVGLVIACVMSYLLQRTRLRGRNIPAFLITLGSGTPSVVIALGLIMTMRGNFGVNIYNTAWILIIAYLIKYQMMGMRTVVSAMSQIHSSLEECSQVAGASWFTTMRRITGPLIFPSIAAGWFLIFIPSFYELSMTTLLYSSTTKTIGFQLYEYWTFTSEPMSCAMAFGILLIVVLLNFVLNLLTRGEFSI